jgi:hypothetical protein
MFKLYIVTKYIIILKNFNKMNDQTLKKKLMTIIKKRMRECMTVCCSDDLQGCKGLPEFYTNSVFFC